MAAPQRVRLSRASGWRKPEGTVNVARPGRWGNPVRVDDIAAQRPDLSEAGHHRVAVQHFEKLVRLGTLTIDDWISHTGDRGPVTFTYPPLRDVRSELAGRDLACWCHPNQACHADVLLEVANGEGMADLKVVLDDLLYTRVS